MFKRLLRAIFIYVPLGYIALSVLLVFILKWVPVLYTPLMLIRSFELPQARECKWVPLEDISKNLPCAVIASEDQKFLTHGGFDFEELQKMREKHEKKGSPIRGCSTISQQTAKNCFTWCTRTYARKAFEAWYTFLIEKIWGKRRIMEVYLNIIEFGPGIYGAEAAARHYYNIQASGLNAYQAATLACCLPNPLKRNPRWVDKYGSKHRSAVVRDASFVRLDYESTSSR